MTFWVIFYNLKLRKSENFRKICRFGIKQGPFAKNFAKQPKKNYKTKSSYNYFLPLKTPLDMIH